MSLELQNKHGINMPILFYKIGIFLLLMCSIFLYGCGGDDNYSVARGRQLDFLANDPRWGDEVIFTDGLGQKRLLRPKASIDR